ncbi:MAG: PilZ domain-containing protein [Acidobacteriota bacterium]|nr:PilZ domain-containing protein [Acidobacteriota bacterium]
MSAFLLPDDFVLLSLAASDATAPERLIEAQVESVVLRTRCRLRLKPGERLEQLPARLVVRKNTVQGLVELDASGVSLTHDDPVSLTLDLDGPARSTQRRDSWRIGMAMPARFRNLSLARPGQPEEWHHAVVNDLSQGGAALQIQGEPLAVGHRVVIELTLSERHFQLPATVCRAELRTDGKPGCCSLQFSGLDLRERNLLGRALAQAELKLLSRRVRV